MVGCGSSVARLFRSSGDEVAAAPLFDAAFEFALEARDGFLAGDAAHMAALVEMRRAGQRGALSSLVGAMIRGRDTGLVRC